MAAGFQGHHKGSTTGLLSGLPQCTHLGMGLSGPRMKTLAHEAPIAINNHRPH